MDVSREKGQRPEIRGRGAEVGGQRSEGKGPDVPG